MPVIVDGVQQKREYRELLRTFRLRSGELRNGERFVSIKEANFTGRRALHPRCAGPDRSREMRPASLCAIDVVRAPQRESSNGALGQFNCTVGTERHKSAGGLDLIELSPDALQELGQDGEFILSRGRQEGEGSPFLVVAPAAEHPAPASVRWLEHAYALRDALESAWAARPLALVHQQGRPMLLLEDPGGEVLESFLGHPLELTQFLRMAIGLAVALGRLHGRGLIHKDIKPANILVDSRDRRRSGSPALASLRAFRASASRPNLPSSSPEHSPTWHPSRPDE